MNQVLSLKTNFLLTLTVFVSSINISQAQDFGLGNVPEPDQIKLNDDQQKVQALRNYSQQYSLQVNNYIQTIAQKRAEIDAQKQEYEKQSQLLEKKILTNPKVAGKYKSQLIDLKTKINQQQLLDQQADKNVNVAMAWAKYVQEQENNAAYDVSEDQEEIADAARKTQEQLEEQQELTLREMGLAKYYSVGPYGDFYDPTLAPVYPAYPDWFNRPAYSPYAYRYGHHLYYGRSGREINPGGPIARAGGGIRRSVAIRGGGGTPRAGGGTRSGGGGGGRR